MGVSILGDSFSCYSAEPLNNPDPKKFNIEKIAGIGEWVYAEIRYPDCTNYEGLKILVFYKVKIEDIMASKEIDPHFCDNNHIKPIARFEPSELGKFLAWNLVKGGVLCEELENEE